MLYFIPEFCLLEHKSVITKLLNLRASREELIMSKRLIRATLTILIGLMANTAFSQSAEADSKLNAKFNKKEIKAMSADEIAFWNFYVNDGFLVFEIKKEKSQSEMETIDFSGATDKINPLELGLIPEAEAVQTLRLGDTGYGIMIHSEKKIRAKMARLK